MVKNLFVTIYINYSCSRHHSAHVRDVAFKRSATQLFHAQANSPTTFLLTGSFSSTCCPSVVVMLLMVTASRALGTWWKGSVCPSVPRWMASSVISIHTRLWSRKVIWELYFPVPRYFPNRRQFYGESEMSKCSENLASFGAKTICNA